MGYAQDLVSQGVSPTGAVEVILGQPLSQPADRAVVTRLRLPGTAQSLSQARAGATRVATLVPTLRGRSKPGPVPGKVELVFSLATGSDVPWRYIEAIIAETSMLLGTEGRSLLSHLKLELVRIKAKLQAVLDQLARLLSHPPPGSASGAVKAAWEASVRRLQDQLNGLTQDMMSVVQRIGELT